jgi:hypothetical protein
MGFALSDLASVVAAKCNIIPCNVVSGIDERIAKQRRTTLGHTGASSIEIAGLDDGGVKPGIGKQLGSIGEPEISPMDESIIAPLMQPMPGTGHSRESICSIAVAMFESACSSC